MPTSRETTPLIDAARRLSLALRSLPFGPPVTHVYAPLEYAWEAHAEYLRRYGVGRKEIVLVGMNPGPWGMAQTGVPFGEVGHVREWLQIEARIGKPAREHPKRPVLGFACPRREVSGLRLWGWARERFGTPDGFFQRFFIVNYCPLLFLKAEGNRVQNFTPDKLGRDELEPLLVACDRHLLETLQILDPRYVVGVGKFAEARARAVLEATGFTVVIGSIPHPSGANPAANRGWAEKAEVHLRRLGIEVQLTQRR